MTQMECASPLSAPTFIIYISTTISKTQPRSIYLHIHSTMASTNPTPQTIKTTSTNTNLPRYRAIRATYTRNTITVYQAHPSSISTSALESQTFVPPISRTRMTWIKPLSLWMAYHSGYGTNQDRSAYSPSRSHARTSNGCLAFMSKPLGRPE